MTLTKAVSVCFSKYFDFTGRATRSEFWWFYVFYLLITVFMDVADSVMGNTFQFAMFKLFVGLIFILPWITVAARRLHDIGKSGWWQLVGAFTLVFGLILTGAADAAYAAEGLDEDLYISYAALIFAYSGVIFNIIQWVRPSQPGTNKWDDAK